MIHVDLSQTVNENGIYSMGLIVAHMRMANVDRMTYSDAVKVTADAIYSNVINNKRFRLQQVLQVYAEAFSYLRSVPKEQAISDLNQCLKVHMR